MKQILTILCVLGLSVGSIAQSLTLQQDTTFCSDDVAFQISCSNHITNSTGINLNLKWTRNEISMPTGWTTNVCDKNNCYGINTSTQSFFLDNGEEGLLKPLFNPNGTVGTGIIGIAVTSLTAGANYSAYAYYVATANASNAVPTVQELKDVAIYPSPVRDNLQLTIHPNLSVERIDVYNLLGQNVKSFAVKSEKLAQPLNLSVAELEDGFYFLRIAQREGEVISRQFIKE